MSANMTSLVTFLLLFVSLAPECFAGLGDNEISEDSEATCSVPRYAPYFWVKDINDTAIELGVTDPNTSGDVTGYTVYYWGHRFGASSTAERSDRDFGQRNITAGSATFSLGGLKPGFVYCADVTAFNTCGHGPFCVACFENVVTLQSTDNWI